ncbi:MAG: ABC transporter permease [Anaerolineae bacterium]|jgi:ABC-2 type transport system permease protein
MIRIMALIRNEFMRQFSDRSNLIFLVLLPLLFTMIVGAGLRGLEGDPTPRALDISLPVVREDEGVLADMLLDALRAAGVTPEEVDELPPGEFALLIPEDLGQRLYRGESVDLSFQMRSDVNAAPAVEQAVQAALVRLNGAVRLARMAVEEGRALGRFPDEAAAELFFQNALGDIMAATESPSAEAQIVWAAPTSDRSSDMASSAEQASAGQIVTWVQITLLGISEILVDERLTGTLRRMLIVPTSRATVLGSKMIARLVLGLFQIAILMVGGAVLFRVDWGSDPLAAALVSLAFALATVALGTVIATLVQTRKQANSAMVGLSMALAALGGAWFPLEITPPLFRQAVQVLPSTWAMRAYTDVLARGADATGVLPEIGVLLGFATLFTAVAMWRFRRYT